MISSTVIAAFLAAIPAVLAQSNSTSYFTSCSTSFGYYPLPTGTAGVPTWITYVRTTQTILSTSTIQDTITVTPNATMCGGLVTETATVTSTSITTPAATTIPPKAGQLPLLRYGSAGINPTPIPRIKRLQAGSELEVTHLLRRQTAPNYTGGFIVNPDGSTSDLNLIYPHRVWCERRRTVLVTSEVIESAAPTTVTQVPGTATAALSTTTVTTTVTLLETAPTPRVYAACGANNVVNNIPDVNGTRMNFDRVIYRPLEGFPVANEVVVNTTGPVNCCAACQDTATCAGCFFVPSTGQCHLRLTEPPTPPSNATLELPGPATLSGSGASSAFPLPTTNSSSLVPSLPSTSASPQPSTCGSGSLSLFLGTIRGQNSTVFPDRFALYFSNGPCGRFGINQVPVGFDEDDE